MSNEFEPKEDSYYSYDEYNSIRSSNKEKFSLTTPSRLPLKLLSSQIIKPKSQNPKVSLKFKINDFLNDLKWKTTANAQYKEIMYRIEQLSNVSFLGINEIVELLTPGIRVYNDRDSKVLIRMEDLHKAVNLQEFYSGKSSIDFKFAENLKNLVIVDTNSNDINCSYGLFKGSYNQKGPWSNYNREVTNVECLKSCLFLSLSNAYIEDFSKIPSSVIFLNLSDSNFSNLESISHLHDLEFLDISTTISDNLKGIGSFESLEVLNLSQENKLAGAGLVGSYRPSRKDIDISVFEEIAELKNLKVLIVGEKDYATISNSKKILSKLEKKLILTDRKNSNHPWIDKLVEVFNVSKRNQGVKDYSKVNLNEFKKLYRYEWMDKG